MKNEKQLTVGRNETVKLYSDELEGELVQMAQTYLGNPRWGIRAESLKKEDIKSVLVCLKGVFDILDPFSKLNELDLVSNTQDVERIKAYFCRYAYGGTQDCEMFVAEGVRNRTPQFIVKMMILEASTNFVLSNIFKVKWDSIRKMLFGSKIEYIRVRHDLLYRYLKSYNVL